MQSGRRAWLRAHSPGMNRAPPPGPGQLMHQPAEPMAHTRRRALAAGGRRRLAAPASVGSPRRQAGSQAALAGGSRGGADAEDAQAAVGAVGALVGHQDQGHLRRLRPTPVPRRLLRLLRHLVRVAAGQAGDACGRAGRVSGQAGRVRGTAGLQVHLLAGGQAGIWRQRRVAGCTAAAQRRSTAARALTWRRRCPRAPSAGWPRQQH